MKKLIKNLVLMIALVLPLTTVLNAAEDSAESLKKGELLKDVNALTITEVKVTISETGIEGEVYNGINIAAFAESLDVSVDDCKKALKKSGSSDVEFVDIKGTEFAVVDMDLDDIDLIDEKDIDVKKLEGQKLDLPLSDLTEGSSKLDSDESDLPEGMALMSAGVQVVVPEGYTFVDNNVGDVSGNKITYSFNTNDKVENLQATIEKGGNQNMILIIGIVLAVIILIIIIVVVVVLVKKSKKNKNNPVGPMPRPNGPQGPAPMNNGNPNMAQPRPNQGPGQSMPNVAGPRPQQPQAQQAPMPQAQGQAPQQAPTNPGFNRVEPTVPGKHSVPTQPAGQPQNPNNPFANQ